MYVESGGVFSKRMRFVPGMGPGRVDTARVFEITPSRASTVTFTSNWALNAGSSKHAKNRRASAGCSCVNAYRPDAVSLR